MEVLRLTVESRPYRLAQALAADFMEVWEALLERLLPQDPRRPIVQARVARLRREWGL
jgi:cytochrome c-type biogenesis protein CcmH/NrfG